MSPLAGVSLNMQKEVVLSYEILVQINITFTSCLSEEERADWLNTLTVLWLSVFCVSFSLYRGAMGLSALCDCGIFRAC